MKARIVSGIILLLMLITHSSLIAQYDVEYLDCPTCNVNNHNNMNITFTYDSTPTAYVSSDVTSDYGPRDLGSPSHSRYDWHGGVDYSAQVLDDDIGDGIIAIVGGTIHTLRIGNRGYKYIFIDGDHDFGYGHMFTSDDPTRTSNYTAKSGNFFIKLRIGGIYDIEMDYVLITQDNRALSTISGYEVIHPITHDTLITTNVVNAGETIGPIGNSISTGRVTAHLHLYAFENNNFSTDDSITKNPLSLVNHEIPNYIVTIEEPREIQNRGLSFAPQQQLVRLNYHPPDTATSTILVKVEAENGRNGNTYNNLVFNIEKVEIFIKKSYEDNQDYTYIKGPWDESKIIYDGVIGNTDNRYPPNLATRGEANLSKTGIEPWAYADYRQRPWDYFAYGDFVTRIRNDAPMGNKITLAGIAYCNEDARYPDGKYEIKAEVTDVRGNVTLGPKDNNGALDPMEFVIDNYKPYVKKVQLYTDAPQTLFYEEEWEPSGQTINFSDQGMQTQVSAGSFYNGLIVKVTMSEPVNLLSLRVPAFNYMDGGLDPMIENPTEFEFHIPTENIELAEEEVIIFEFEGEDLNGNDLIAFDDGDRTGPYHIPTRTGENQSDWEDLNQPQLTYGKDEIHRFTLGCGSQKPAGLVTGNDTYVYLTSDLEVTYDIENPTYNMNCNNGSVDVHISGGVSPYDVRWYRVGTLPFYWEILIQENLNIQGNNDGEDINNLVEGYYRFEVEDKMCGTYYSQPFYISCICSDDCELTGVVTNPTCTSKGKIDITYSCSEGGHGIPTFKWSDGSELKDRTNLEPGTYCVTVTDEDGCSLTECFRIIHSLKPQVYVEDITNVTKCMGLNSMCDGAINITPVGGPYTYKWTYPNGTTSTSEDISGLCPGDYVLEVTDMDGCTATYYYSICCCLDVSGPISLVGTYTPYHCYNGDFNPNPIDYSIDIELVDRKTLPDGYIYVDVRGGTGNYYCHWTGPDGFYSTSCGGISGINTPGQYCLTVDDGCYETTKCWNIGDCRKYDLFPRASARHTCKGYAFGEIEASGLFGEGAAPPHTYKWSTGETTAKINSLAAGIYCVTITNNNGCFADTCITILESTPLIPKYDENCLATYECNGYATDSVAQFDKEMKFTPLNCSKSRYCNGVLQTPLGDSQSHRVVECYDNSGFCYIYDYCPIDGNVYHERTGYTDLKYDHYKNDRCYYKVICNFDGGSTYECGSEVQYPRVEETEYAIYYYCGDILVDTKYLSALHRNVKISISPNPFINYFNLKIEDVENTGVISILLINSLGFIEKKIEKKIMPGENTFTTYNSELSDGLYILKVIDEKGNLLKTDKIIKLTK